MPGGNMDMFGDLGAGGVVLSQHELVERRRRSGQCPTCGQRCFEKKLFKMKPMSVPGKVLKGRCLACNPQDPSTEQLEAACVAAPAPPPRGRSNRGSGVSGSRSERSRGGLTASMPDRPFPLGPGRMEGQRMTSMGNIAEDDGEGDEPFPSRSAPPSTSAARGMRAATHAVMAVGRAPPSSQQSQSSRGTRVAGAAAHAVMATSRGGGSPPPSSRQNSSGVRVAAHAIIATGRTRHAAPTNNRVKAVDFNGSSGEPRSTGGSGRSSGGGGSERSLGNNSRGAGSGISSRSGGGSARSAGSDIAGGEDESAPDRRDSSPRAASRHNSFLNRQTPRPSAVFLDGINIDDLIKDDFLDFSDDEGDGGGDAGDANRGIELGRSHANSSSSIHSAARRLSKNERQALQTLNSRECSFTDIVNIMLTNSTSATVNNEGLHALSLVHDPRVEMLRECAESCGFEVIVSAMGKCGKDAMAQTNACKVLFIAGASGEDLQIAIGRAGGIDALVDAMKEFDDDVIVLEGSLLALSNLCIPDENLDFALGTDMIELAVNAMSKNVDNCGLQEHGCAVLANLAVHQEARLRIRNCGGCDTVVVSMVVNPMDVGVQSQALVTLRNLCVGDEENKVLLANSGAIDVVLQAMQNHRDDPTIQSRASWVLGIIGTNEDNKLHIGENGGPEAVVRSMWVFPKEVTVQEKGCRALWTMSVHPHNRFAIMDADAIPAIVAAMQNHAAEPSIQERGCGALCNLAANDDDLKIRIVNDGALDVIVMSMVLHGENENIQERAVALLHKLCIPENINAMVSANVSPMMAVVAETFPLCRERAVFVIEQLG